MHLSGPSSVNAGANITVTASGVANAYSVKFDVNGVSGNVGFDVKVTRGSNSVSFTESMSFAGSESISALAQDEFGNTLASATHSFTVKATSMQDDGPGAGGGYVLNIEAPGRVVVNSPFNYTIGGLSRLHSVLIELYGANGGLFRLFPRGRDRMVHAIVPRASGLTTVIVMGRDSQLRPVVSVAGQVEVLAQGQGFGFGNDGPGAGGGYRPLSQISPVPVMDVVKPPFAISAMDQTNAGQSGAASSAGGASYASAGGGFSSPASNLDALIEAKKAELLARLGKK
jgi:hypothetical protein